MPTPSSSNGRPSCGRTSTRVDIGLESVRGPTRSVLGPGPSHGLLAAPLGAALHCIADGPGVRGSLERSPASGEWTVRKTFSVRTESSQRCHQQHVVVLNALVDDKPLPSAKALDYGCIRGEDRRAPVFRFRNQGCVAGRAAARSWRHQRRQARKARSRDSRQSH